MSGGIAVVLREDSLFTYCGTAFVLLARDVDGHFAELRHHFLMTPSLLFVLNRDSESV